VNERPSWRGEFPHEPRFGRRGRAWFRRRIRRWAETVLTQAGGEGEARDLAADRVADFFTARCEDYVEWRDEETFRGARFADGTWVILWRKVEQDWPRALDMAVGGPDPSLSPPPMPAGEIDVESAGRSYGMVAREAIPELHLGKGTPVLFFPDNVPGRRLIYRRGPLEERQHPSSLVPERYDLIAQHLVNGRLVLEHSILFGEILTALGRCEDESQPIPQGPIDLDAALAALAASEAGIAEPRAFDLLRGKGPWSDACNRLRLAQDRIQRKAARRCRVCDTDFIGRQVHVATCDSCKAAGQKRCCACDEVFTTTNPKAKRCTSCIERDAALQAERTRAKERGKG
jgi:hypothetical protein